MTPLEYLYYLGYTLHKKYRLSARKRLDGRVLSIGNLTLGGTGKTPAAIAIAREAVRRQLRPCILTRGYRGHGRGAVIVSKGDKPLTSWVEAGDEAVLMAERLKGVWVIKDANRYRGGLIASNRDLFILDDGFQHWRLHRDIDILIVDATNPFGNGRMIPLGSLREPVSEMKRADVIIISKTRGKVPGLEEIIRKHNERAPLFYADYRMEGLTSMEGKTMPPDTLRGKKVFAFSGIGNPSGFIAALSGLGAAVTGHKAFRDHHCYRDKEIAKIMKRAVEDHAEMIITTEKDMVKLRELKPAARFTDIFALKVSLDINGGEFYDIIFKGLAPGIQDAANLRRPA
ncbi:MAG: tetraacyldisaccharide 4'-kinase [Nitrospirae bacterium]|nr:tetraacyldisaccharide 4'-kinase [Nitrospirota bacterium]